MQENSIALTTEQADAFRLDAELKYHAGAVVSEVFETARCLYEIKERRLYEYLGETTFDEYAEKITGLRPRAVANYIGAYKTYGADGLKKYGEIGITKLVALAQLNDTDRSELLESGEASELSSRKLDERIKELKGENDQLRFELDDAETTAKNNAEQIAALKKQLEEAQRPVVASMSDEEKEEIRREAEKKAKAEADKAIKTMKKEHDQSLKTLRNNIDAANNATSERDKTISEQKGEIHRLTAELETEKRKNERLQANAEKPVIAGGKETLKFCLEDIQAKAGRAVEIISGMEQDDKEKYKAGLINIASKLREAAEGIV